MRPPDENQPDAMRALSISVTRRPASADDNILARLERDGRRGGARPAWKRSWIAWCSVASLAIIGMLGLLASLARENVALHQPTAAAGSTTASDPYNARAPTVASEGTTLAPLPTSDPTPDPAAMPAQPKPPAMVVDAQPAGPSPAMLKPAPLKAAAMRPAASARRGAPVAAAKPPPTRTSMARIARLKKPSPAPERAPAAPPEPAVDSDVALLSAIILHSSRHAGERAQLEAARCAGRQCAPTRSPDPLTSLKGIN